MKKGEQPEFSSRWWKSSQPKGLKSADKLEDALKAYEATKKKLESSGDEDAAKAAKTALGSVETAVDAVVSEASKDKKSPEMALTVDALKKYSRLYGTEEAWIEDHTEKDDDSVFTDPDAYHDYLLGALKRLHEGTMNFGFVLGKKAEDHRLALHRSKGSKALGNALLKETGLHAMTFGTAMPDNNNTDVMVLVLEGRQLPGMQKKGERMLKKFKPLPFTKLGVVVNGKEVEDLDDPEDTDVDDPDEVAARGAGVVPMGGGQSGAAGDLDAPPPPPTDSFVYFSRNSSDLTADDKKALQGYVDRYVAAATPTPIVLSGYASLDGDARFNRDLSQKRADAVKKFMAGTIKEGLISAKGLGPVAKFRSGLAAANRCVEFGPPVAAPSARPPAGQAPGGKPQDGGSQQGGGKQQDGGSAGDGGTQKVSANVNPTPGVSLTDKQFTDIFGADVLAQWNAFRSKSGPVPPARQLTLTLTLKGSLKHQDKDKGNLHLDWIDEPSIAVVFNSSGVAANDQEAISVFKAHWDNTILKRPIEASVLAVTQNLFTSGASPQEGGQPQVKALVTKQIGVVVGGQFMLGDDPKGKFGFNATGFLGLDVTLF